MSVRSTRPAWMKPLGLALVAFGCASLVAPFARADDPQLPVELEWTAPAECPTREAVLERVRRLVDVAEQPHDVRIEAHGSIVKRDALLELDISIREGAVEDVRVLRSPTCGVLVEATVIMLATALDASRRSSVPVKPPASRDTPRPAEAVAPPAVEPVRHVEPRAPLRGPSDGPSFSVGLAPIFDFGTLPRPAAGLEAAASIAIGHVRGGLAGTLYRAQEQTFEGPSQVGAEFHIQTAGLFGCWTLGHGRLRFGPCSAIDVTHLKAEGFGIRRPGTSRAVFPTLRVGLLTETRVGARWSVFARADASFAVGAPSIVMTTTASNLAVHDVGVPALRLTIGASFTLP